MSESRDYVLGQFLELAKFINPEWENGQALRDLMISNDLEKRPDFWTSKNGTIEISPKLTTPNSGITFLKEIMQ